jgi:hypothetical protein
VPRRRGITQRTGKKGLFVDSKLSGAFGAYNQVACAQCHSGVRPVSEGRPCQTVQKVNCAARHEQQCRASAASTLARQEGEKEAPTCVSCHGSHTILESAVPDRATAELRRHPGRAEHRRNVPDLCSDLPGRSGDASLRTPATEGQIEHYRDRARQGPAAVRADRVSETASTATRRTRVPPADAASSVAPENIVHTCGKCHDGIYEHLRNSALAGANPDYSLGGQPKLPDCNDNHTAHSVARATCRASGGRSSTSVAKCHAEITGDLLRHLPWQASKLGNKNRALPRLPRSRGILPKDDARSTLHADHIVGTCATCHPNSNTGFTGFLAHARTPTRRTTAALLGLHGHDTALIGTFRLLRPAPDRVAAEVVAAAAAAPPAHADAGRQGASGSPRGTACCT